MRETPVSFVVFEYKSCIIEFITQQGVVVKLVRLVCEDGEVCMTVLPSVEREAT